MLRIDKELCVKELGTIYQNFSSIIITHYHGLTVDTLMSLRKELRINDGKFQIIKNTLSKIALKDAGLDLMSGKFSGPTAIAYSNDPLSSAKTIVQFTKDHGNLKIIAGLVDNQLLSSKELQYLAALPSLGEIRSQFINIIQAPATRISQVVESPVVKLVRLLQAYSNN